MPKGYLIVETRADRPGITCIHATEHLADPESPSSSQDADTKVHFAARFGNLFVARMHAHTALRGRTLDAEAGLYRTDPATAIAAIDAIDLRHEQLYLDPAIAADPGLAQATEHRRRNHRRVDRIFNGVGIAAIILLVLLAIAGI
ncbi:hypothetical protein G3480_06395 [Thiorhodococcus mannitoliphagus]|uniref:Uncharacterized protein n=1 Tax=Thiorhodococcus mannitoliphagus TaxID=329406 RepID=A0A6P1DW78_9GAMM|nr:hypothetical protein [Thiorhodococcus mannitoliphagus]NEX19944.1 hypothetical protein [Thiorhodococcus mannitoliphagus]